MKRKFAVVTLLGLALAAGSVRTLAADAASGDLVTESQFAKWLVKVVGLARFVPAAPTDQECYMVLMQNGIAPKNGWNSTNVVTMGTLSRVLVLAMDKESEVENPDDDAAWIKVLQAAGVQLDTIGGAMKSLDPLDNAIGSAALFVTTDPLKKQHKIRAIDEQQLGVDLSQVRTPVTFEEMEEVVVTPPKPPTKPKKMTPN
jgi:hypothetical protein